MGHEPAQSSPAAPEPGPGGLAARLEHQGPPRLRARFGPLALPWLPLGTLPTPVQPLPALSRELGAEVWVKRDDLSGARYGGNKVRKLELLLADALARGRASVVTNGAWGSHHALATAIYAAEVGLEAHLVLSPQPLTPHVLDDLILDQAVGARLHRCRHPALGPLVSRAVSARCPRPAVIPTGGSSPLGALGFVEAGLELADQVAAGELPRPDRIVVATGTCGTAAGLALGLELAGLPVAVEAVRVVGPIVTNLPHLRRLQEGAWRLLRQAGLPDVPRRRVRVHLDGAELGRGYGAVTPAARAAVERLAAEGLELETTYTGKAAAALLRLGATEARGERLLFWQTYNGVDLAPLLARAHPEQLPPAFHPILRRGGRL